MHARQNSQDSPFMQNLRETQRAKPVWRFTLTTGLDMPTYTSACREGSVQHPNKTINIMENRFPRIVENMASSVKWNITYRYAPSVTSPKSDSAVAEQDQVWTSKEDVHDGHTEVLSAPYTVEVLTKKLYLPDWARQRPFAGIWWQERSKTQRREYLCECLQVFCTFQALPAPPGACVDSLMCSEGFPAQQSICYQ